jgi:hypothetical protein
VDDIEGDMMKPTETDSRTCSPPKPPDSPMRWARACRGVLTSPTHLESSENGAAVAVGTPRWRLASWAGAPHKWFVRDPPQGPRPSFHHHPPRGGRSRTSTIGSSLCGRPRAQSTICTSSSRCSPRIRDPARRSSRFGHGRAARSGCLRPGRVALPLTRHES